MTKAPSWLVLEPAAPIATFLFAHGAGAPMDTPFMTTFAEGLALGGIRVQRFEFSYMSERRTGGKKRPPPRGEGILDEWRAAIADAPSDLPLFIGGKSMGGRLASMVVGEHAQVAGLICLGYPFHPAKKPEKLRTAHLAALETPTLIVQGDRDPMGTKAEVAGYALSGQIELCWLPDGDHDFKPRKASGFAIGEHWQTAVAEMLAFMERVVGSHPG